MSLSYRSIFLWLTAMLLIVLVTAASAQPVDSTASLIGLWCSKLRFGPDMRGELTITRGAHGWRAEIAGFAQQFDVNADSVNFTIADGLDEFRGRIKDAAIIGHWIQQRTFSSGSRYATPVTLSPIENGRWRGTVRPSDDQLTYFLPITSDTGNFFKTYLRNPERNIGRFINLDHIRLSGGKVKLLGKQSDGDSESVMIEGPYDAENQSFSLYDPWHGGTYDFSKASAVEEMVFYPRGREPQSYQYYRPELENDGWSVSSLSEEAVDADSIARFIQVLTNLRMDSLRTPDIHAVLIARHGKLVLEEYFHGFHKNETHDLRSASKSFTSLLTGAVILKRQGLSESSPVFPLMGGVEAYANPNPLKSKVLVEHLLTMSSGLDCDDNDPKSPGNENTMQDQQEQPDWYRYTLDLKMIREPGELAVYCSCNPNLLGGVLGKATHEWLPDLFRELIAEPLQIEHYAMNLTPTAEAYMGGGLQLRARDFLKLGQVILNHGSWNGKQVVSTEWASKSVSPLYDLQGRKYGYLWWVTEYPYHDRKVQAFFAAGNGGQIVMGFPELDMVVLFMGGNYGDRTGSIAQREYIPQYILPAVK